MVGEDEHPIPIKYPNGMQKYSLWQSKSSSWPSRGGTVWTRRRKISDFKTRVDGAL